MDHIKFCKECREPVGCVSEEVWNAMEGLCDACHEQAVIMIDEFEGARAFALMELENEL